MLIFGHRAITHKGFTQIKKPSQIPANASKILYFTACDDVDYTLSRHCFENRAPYAVITSNVSELLIYASLGASYAIAPLSCLKPRLFGAPSLQAIADRYLLDLKILAIIEHESELASVARFGIDGAIFSHLLA